MSMKRKKRISIIIIIIILIIICLIIMFFIFSSHASTLGTYYGVSRDNKWETSFEVLKENNNIILRGNVICLDDNMIKNYSEEEIDKNLITIFKSNGLSFGGNYINRERNKFILINYVKDDGYLYNRMIIAIGSSKIELKITKKK